MENPLIARRLQEIAAKEAAMGKAGVRAEKMGLWRSAALEKVKEAAPDALRETLEKSFREGIRYFLGPGMAALDKIVDSTVPAEAAYTNRQALRRAPSRENLRQISKIARTARQVSLGLTTAEGTLLGVLGVGLPDIPVFMGALLGSCFAIAKSFGFDHHQKAEQALALMMIQAALVRGKAYPACTAAVDRGLFALANHRPFAYDMELCLENAASALALELLALKFVQGIPVVGVVGGIGNFVYAEKITAYTAVKYEKRFLLGQMYSSP